MRRFREDCWSGQKVSAWVLSGAERGLVSKLFGREENKMRLEKWRWVGLVNQVKSKFYPGCNGKPWKVWDKRDMI